MHGRQCNPAVAELQQPPPASSALLRPPPPSAFSALLCRSPSLFSLCPSRAHAYASSPRGSQWFWQTWRWGISSFLCFFDSILCDALSDISDSFFTPHRVSGASLPAVQLSCAILPKMCKCRDKVLGQKFLYTWVQPDSSPALHLLNLNNRSLENNIHHEFPARRI